MSQEYIAGNEFVQGNYDITKQTNYIYIYHNFGSAHICYYINKNNIKNQGKSERHCHKVRLPIIILVK